MNISVRIFLLSLITFLLAADSPQYEVVLRGGKVIDGSGSPSRLLDLAITGDKIVKLAAPGSLSAKTTISVEGSYVAPGFIDMLGQSEIYLMVSPHQKSKITQGITTELTGEGGSPAPNNDWIIQEDGPFLKPYNLTFDWRSWNDYFTKIRKNQFATNMAFLVGATQVRKYVMQKQMRAPSATELQEMRKLVETSLQSGAHGLSSSLIYAPATYAKTEELVELAKGAAAHGGFYATHMRSESQAIVEALDEAITIGKRAKLPVEIWHLKVGGSGNFHKMKTVLSRIEKERAAGMDISANMYPYTAGATSLTSSLPSWAMQGDIATMLRRLADPETRARIKKEIRIGRIMIGSVKNPALKKYAGKWMEDVARDRGVDNAEALMWLIQQDEARSRGIYFSQSEEEMERALRAPFVSFGCDSAGVEPEGILGQEYPHPRAYGTFPRVLGLYVRQKKLIGLEEAIRKMTSLPAHRLNLKKRGLLKEGFYADITVFDFNKIIDRATYENPHQYSEGVIHVFINGEQVISNRKITDRLPGRVLLHNQDN